MNISAIVYDTTEPSSRAGGKRVVSEPLRICLGPSSRAGGKQGGPMDLYSKIVLTVIAVCLVVIALRSTPIVRAGDPGQPVNIVAVGGRMIFGGELPVAVK